MEQPLCRRASARLPLGPARAAVRSIEHLASRLYNVAEPRRVDGRPLRAVRGLRALPARLSSGVGAQVKDQSNTLASRLYNAGRRFRLSPRSFSAFFAEAVVARRLLRRLRRDGAQAASGKNGREVDL
jgi:hypothetical protein